MSDHNAQYGITITANGTAAVYGIQAVRSSFAGLDEQVASTGTTAQATGRQIASASANIEASGQAASTAAPRWAGWVGAIAGAAAALVSVGALVRTVTNGIDNNTQLENATAGMAALISAQNEIRDAQGRVLEGQDAYNAAVGISQEQMKKLQVDGLATTATFQELVGVYSSLLGPAQALGLSIDDSRRLTVGLVQAAGAMKIPMEQVETSARHILQGSIETENQLAAQLGITNAQVNAWKEQGTLVEELQRRLQAYAVAGAAAARTWDGMVAGLQEAGDQITQRMTAGLFESVKEAGLDAFDTIFQRADDGSMQLNDNLAAVLDWLSGGLTAIGDELGSLLNGGIDLLSEFGAYIDGNSDKFSAMSEPIGHVWQAIKDIGAMLLGAIGTIIDWGVQTGFFSGLLSTVALIVAGIADGFEVVGATIKKIGALVIDTLMSPIEFVFDKLASAAEAIGLDTLSEGMRNTAANVTELAQRWNAEADATLTKFANGESRVAKVLEDIANGSAAAGAAQVDAADKATAATEQLTLANKRAGEAAQQAGRAAQESWDKFVQQTANKAEAALKDMYGFTQAQHKEMAALDQALQDGAVSTAAYEQAMQKIWQSTDAYKDMVKRTAEEQKKFQAAIDAQTKAEEELHKKTLAEVESQRQANAQLREQIETYGLTERQVAALTLAKLEAAAASDVIEAGFNLENAALREQIDLVRERIDLLDQKALLDADQATVDAWTHMFDKAGEQIQQSITDHIIEGGKFGFNEIKNIAKSVVLRPVVDMVVKATVEGIEGLLFGNNGLVSSFLSWLGVSGDNGLVQALLGTGNGSGGGGMLSQLASLAGGGGSGGGILSQLADWLGFGSGSSAAPAAAAGVGAAGAAAAGGSLALSGSTYSSLGALAAAEWLGGGSLAATQGASLGLTSAGTLGSSAGSSSVAMSGAGGASAGLSTVAYGAGLAAVFYAVFFQVLPRIFTSLLGRKHRDVGFAKSDGLSVRPYNWMTGDYKEYMNEQAREMMKSIEAGWDDVAASLKLQNANAIGFAIGIKHDRDENSYREWAEAFYNDRSLGISGGDKLNYSGFQKNLERDVYRAYLRAAQAISGGDMWQILSTVDASSASKETIQKVFGDAAYWAQVVEPMRDQLTRIFGWFDARSFLNARQEGEDFAAVIARLSALFETTARAAAVVGQTIDQAFPGGIASQAQRQALVDRFGGLEELSRALDYYQQAFQPELYADYSMRQAGLALQSVFAGLNQAVPTSREQFDALVQSIDLSTDAGKNLFTSLMQTAQMFNEFVGALDDLSQTMSDSIDGLRRSVALDGLNDQARYNLLKAEADNAYQEFQSATTVEDVEKHFKLIMADMAETWGMLSDAQKNLLRAEYQQKLDELEMEKNERIAMIKAQYLGLPSITPEPIAVDPNAIWNIDPAAVTPAPGKPAALSTNGNAAYLQAQQTLRELASQSRSFNAQVNDAGTTFSNAVRDSASTWSTTGQRVSTSIEAVADRLEALTSAPITIVVSPGSTAASQLG